MKRFLIRSCFRNANPCYVEIQMRAPKVVLITYFCRIFQKICFVCGKAMNQIAKLHRKIDYFLYHARTQTWYSWTCTSSLEDNHCIRIKQSNDIILEKGSNSLKLSLHSTIWQGTWYRKRRDAAPRFHPCLHFHLPECRGLCFLLWSSFPCRIFCYFCDFHWEDLSIWLPCNSG